MNTMPGRMGAPLRDLGWMLLVGAGTLVANGTPLANTLDNGLFSPLAYNVLQFGMPAVLLTRAANELVDARRLPAWLAYPAVVLATILGGIWVIAPLLQSALGKVDWWGRAQDLNLAATSVAWHALGMTVYVQRRRSRRAQAWLEAAQEAAATRQRQLAAAQLLALQARVDPELLSDQLGVIDAELARTPPRALARLAALIELLRAQQPHLDAEVSTLAREATALRAYASLVGPDAGDLTPQVTSAQASHLTSRLHLAANLADPPAWPLAPMVLLPLLRPLLEADGTLWSLSLHTPPGQAAHQATNPANPQAASPGATQAQLRLQALGPDEASTRAAAARVPLGELSGRLQAVHGPRAGLVLSPTGLPLFTLTWPVPAGPLHAPVAP